MSETNYFSEKGIRTGKLDTLFGFKEPKETNEWFSNVLKREVFVLRAPPTNIRDVKLPEAMKGDKVRAYQDVAALHMVNYASIRNLKEAVKLRSEGDKSSGDEGFD